MSNYMFVSENQKTSPGVSFLIEIFHKRQKHNASYSIAAFARDLGVSASFLSRLLKGDRALTPTTAIKIAAVLNVPAQVLDEWNSEIVLRQKRQLKTPLKAMQRLTQKATLSEKYPVNYFEVERFHLLSQWYHFAILSLTHLPNFRSNPAWIAKRLGIAQTEVIEAIERLLNFGLLKRSGSSLKQTKNMLYVRQDRPDQAIGEYHFAVTQLAQNIAIDASHEAFENRFFAGMSLAFNRRRMPEFKEKLKAISEDMLRSTVNDDYTDVFQFNLQLFPLTCREFK